MAKQNGEVTDVMPDDFKTFVRTRGAAEEDPNPKVTVTKSGIASFNRAASLLFDGVERMEVAVSPSGRLVQITAVEKGGLKLGDKNGKKSLNLEPAIKFAGATLGTEPVTSEPKELDGGRVIFAF